MKLHTLLGIVTILVVIAACTKGGFSSTPHLTFKSASTNRVEMGQNLVITLEYTDAEGDFSDSFYVQKISSAPCPDASFTDSALHNFPDVPKKNNSKGTIEVTLDYNLDLHTQPCNGVDTVETAVFRFWLKDKAGHISDTCSSSPIKIVKQ